MKKRDINIKVISEITGLSTKFTKPAGQKIVMVQEAASASEVTG